MTGGEPVQVLPELKAEGWVLPRGGAEVSGVALDLDAALERRDWVSAALLAEDALLRAPEAEVPQWLLLCGTLCVRLHQYEVATRVLWGASKHAGVRIEALEALCIAEYRAWSTEVYPARDSATPTAMAARCITALQALDAALEDEPTSQHVEQARSTLYAVATFLRLSGVQEGEKWGCSAVEDWEGGTTGYVRALALVGDFEAALEALEGAAGGAGAAALGDADALSLAVVCYRLAEYEQALAVLAALWARPAMRGWATASLVCACQVALGEGAPGAGEEPSISPRAQWGAMSPGRGGGGPLRRKTTGPRRLLSVQLSDVDRATLVQEAANLDTRIGGVSGAVGTALDAWLHNRAILAQGRDLPAALRALAGRASEAAVNLLLLSAREGRVDDMRKFLAEACRVYEADVDGQDYPHFQVISAVARLHIALREAQDGWKGEVVRSSNAAPPSPATSPRLKGAHPPSSSHSSSDPEGSPHGATPQQHTPTPQSPISPTSQMSPELLEALAALTAIIEDEAYEGQVVQDQSRAALFAATGRHSEAVEALRALSDFHTSSAAWEASLGAQLVLAGEPGALAHLERAVALAPELARDPAQRVFRVAALLAEGATRRAARAADELPARDQSHLLLARLFAARAHWRRAVRHYEAVRLCDPEMAPPLAPLRWDKAGISREWLYAGLHTALGHLDGKVSKSELQGVLDGLAVAPHPPVQEVATRLLAALQ